MSNTINLKELERKAWRSYFQDGLWDIFLGLLLLAMAVSAALGDSGMPESQSMPIFIGLEVFAMLVLWAGKRFVTVPRMGRVKFSRDRKMRQVKVRVLLIISVVIGLVAFLAPLILNAGPPATLDMRIFLPALWVGNVLIVFGLAAYFLDFPRLYAIAVLFAIAVPLDIMFKELLGLDLSPVAFGGPALVILSMGLLVFVRFLRTYPPLTGGPSAEGAFDGNS